MRQQQSEPPSGEICAAPWSERERDFTLGLPSWMAPKLTDEPAASADDPVMDVPSYIPSVPPSQPVIRSVRPETIPPPIRDYEGEIEALQGQLEACVQGMSRMRRRVLEASERHLVQLAMVIAERVVGRELKAEPALVARWAKEGVNALAAEDTLTVTVSPDVAAVLEEIGSWSGNREVTIAVDANQPPLTCEVRGEMGNVDAGMRARVAAMSDTIGIREDD